MIESKMEKHNLTLITPQSSTFVKQQKANENSELVLKLRVNAKVRISRLFENNFKEDGCVVG